MNYKYSICYPDKEQIQYIDTPISGNEVVAIAKKFDWLEQLKLTESINPNKVYYSPSLDFKCIENERSFCLTADFNKNKEIEFSLWYNRPKKVKILFGLLGESEKMVVDDVWNFKFDEAIKYLEHFVNRNYQIIENLYKK
jgi:hypothetical protein